MIIFFILNDITSQYDLFTQHKSAGTFNISTKMLVRRFFAVYHTFFAPNKADGVQLLSKKKNKKTVQCDRRRR